MLYEMVAGRAPFTGDTPREVMASILETGTATPHNSIAQTPAELKQIISKALRKSAKNGIRAPTNCSRRSKVSVAEWNSRRSWNARPRLLRGCAGHDPPLRRCSYC